MWHVLNLGQVDYAQGLLLQDSARALAQAATGQGFLLCLEHPPTITLGRRAGQAELRQPPPVIEAAGGVVNVVARGGLATAHEPGQVVIYPVVRLADLKLGAHDYMLALQGAMQSALRELGAPLVDRADHRGVFTPLGKVGFMGVAVKEGVAFHGVAVNVNNTLAAFDWIVPCGLHDEPITTLQKLGLTCPPAQVTACLCAHISQALPLG